jgi:hypothetical protein
MTVLHLGINEIPYADGRLTTFEVAEILESRYGVMMLFSLLHGSDITEGLESALQDKIDNFLMGAPGQDLSTMFPEGSLGSIEQAFRKMLDDRELDGRAPGIPTEASLRGVSHRLLHPYAKSNPPRPSLIDTGAYQANMRAWVTES